MSSCRVVTAPGTEPITLAEAQAQVRAIVVAGVSADDTRLGTLIKGARAFVEAFLHRSLITQTRELVLDRFPLSGPILVEYGPVASVTHLAYLDSAGEWQTDADLTTYDVDLYSVPARIVPAYGYSWPTIQPGLNRVKVRYVAGYGAASDVPQDIKDAMLLLVGHLFENREQVVTGTIATELPLGVEDFLRQHVVHGS